MMSHPFAQVIWELDSDFSGTLSTAPHPSKSLSSKTVEWGESRHLKTILQRTLNQKLSAHIQGSLWVEDLIMTVSFTVQNPSEELQQFLILQFSQLMVFHIL